VKAEGVGPRTQQTALVITINKATKKCVAEQTLLLLEVSRKTTGPPKLRWAGQLQMKSAE
jgi:hypothetical protein